MPFSPTLDLDMSSPLSRASGFRFIVLLGIAVSLAPATSARAAVLPSQPCPPNGGVPVEQLSSTQVKVCTPDEFVGLLRREPPFEGRVVIPRDVSWNLGRFPTEIPLRSNLEIVGERGDLASRPLLYNDIQIARGYAQFELTGRNVRFEGIHLKGPKLPSQHTTQTPYVDGIKVVQDAANQLGRDVVIADNEFDNWSGGAVWVGAPYGNELPSVWRQHPEWKHYNYSDVGILRVERNYMHHNVMHNGGYGVVVSSGGWVTINGNLFETNRHAVAATGRAFQGYAARFNYVLEGGYKQGYAWNQHFDVHGETPSGKNKGYGGAAGTKFEITHNTIRGEQGYYCVPVAGCTQARPAFMLRGTPTDGAFWQDNVVVHDDKDEAVALQGRAPSDIDIRRILPTSERQFNFKSGGNAYDKDYTREIMLGEFDGDGRTDVFLAAGTAWFISRAGLRPWEFIRPSTKTKRDLALADIDNDGITDVLYRDSAGNLGYVKSGRAANVTPLTKLPVPIKDLRFGDFDGDSRLDMFYTQNKQWRISYGRSSPRRFVNAQTSVSPIDELLFGTFDNVPGTDVVAVKNAGWMYSSSGTGSYTKLNNRLTNSFRGAVVADFDGDGRVDIGFNGDEKWAWAPSGQGSARLLRRNASTPIQNVLFGKFDRQPRVQGLTYSADGLRFIAWRGLGSKDAFERREPSYKMR